MIEARVDFCAETVFSHESKVDPVAAASEAGYGVADYPPRWPVWAPEPLLGP